MDSKKMITCLENLITKASTAAAIDAVNYAAAAINVASAIAVASEICGKQEATT